MAADVVNRIVGFWHIGALGDWSRIVTEQYRTLRESGLYDASEKIVVGFIGGMHRTQALMVPIMRDPKFDVFVTDDVADYEYPTLARVWKEARERAGAFLCYYIHTKGASLAGTATQASANAWRVYMEYFNIERWRDCVEVLRWYDTCGVELQDDQSHYSGNFWWATSDYVRTLPDGYAFWNSHQRDRSAAEFYVCSARPKAYCFNDFVEDLYEVAIPAERYRVKSS